jgi:hypothetical protein
VKKGEEERECEVKMRGWGEDPLFLTPTLSCRVYQCSLVSLRSREATGSLTSPRNWFLPNLSQSHTLTHRVQEASSDGEN